MKVRILHRTMSVSSSLSALSIIFTGKQTLTRRTVRRIILLNNLNNSIRRRWQSGNTSNSSSSNSSHHDAVIHNNERGSASKDDDHAYCVNLVRERDREGYRKFIRKRANQFAICVYSLTHFLFFSLYFSILICHHIYLRCAYLHMHAH